MFCVAHGCLRVILYGEELLPGIRKRTLLISAVLGSTDHCQQFQLNEIYHQVMN